MKSEVSLECFPLGGVASGKLITALRAGPSRITIRLFKEASSAFAYNFPIMAVGQLNQSSSGLTTINTKAVVATVVVNKLVSTVNRTIFETAFLLKMLVL